MDFILPTLVCLDLDIHASTLDNTIHPLLVMKPEEETIFSITERDWKIDTVLWPLIPRYNVSPGSSAHTSLTLPFNRMVFELHTECCCPQEWLHLLSSREEEEKEVNGSRCTSVKDSGGSSCVLWFCSVLLLHSLRYMASMDQYRWMNCVQHSVLNTTRECFVYRSCSLLTVLVFLADLHAKIHCVTGFGRTSLSTPFLLAALLSALYATGKLACPLGLTFLLVEVLQMVRPCSSLVPGNVGWTHGWIVFEKQDKLVIPLQFKLEVGTGGRGCCFESLCT